VLCRAAPCCAALRRADVLALLRRASLQAVSGASGLIQVLSLVEARVVALLPGAGGDC
jgi:hypothetical protein